MIENHILAPYFATRLDEIGAKIQAIAVAQGIPKFIPVQFALQIPVKNFRYTAPAGGVEGYLKGTADILSFPATCFGGFVIVEKNVRFISELDPDDCTPIGGESPAYQYKDFECGPMVIPNSHAMFARADIKILDNALGLDVNGAKTPCPNILEIGKPYKEDVIPLWLRPTPMTDAEAATTELATDDEAASPAIEGECRKYHVEVFILEQTDENGVPVRSFSMWLLGGKSLLKCDVVLNGYLLYNPACRMKYFCTTPLHPVTPPCTLIADILTKVQQQF